MGKIMKPGKVVLLLAGKYSGRKAVILKNQDEGTNAKSYGHALVAGIDRYPRPVTRRMGKKKRAKRSRIKPFLKVVNYNHMMPTRYIVEMALEKVDAKEIVKDQAARRKARQEVRSKMEERYKSGKNKWFFTKLRF
ncbi:ribosomal protein L27 [Dermatophagoides farinae]|uniref:60S ribosomal protein L27 n=1 Tax=Dermatophagoides farinae TaxID=6954 RepID=A0A922L2U7_DERFA|nr:60S ribosomal protein L27-like [Dermatophagoides farinae]KAH7645720.1 60s ribosomal protein l27-like protein [Dermatophagoides farinae]KAH9515906.1 60S ribosomal protein L27, variant 2 [Dermatophagoides farinae]